MAKQAAGVTDALLVCAKEEFLEKGYENASLRNIAQRSRTSTTSIYTRFGDKEGLYHALVDPVVSGAIKWAQGAQDGFDQKPASEKHDVMDYSQDKMGGFLSYIYGHFDEFRLLINCPTTHSFEALLHQLVEMEVKYTVRYLQAIGHSSLDDGSLSRELFHILSSAFYEGIFEVVRHNMPIESARRYVQQIQRFHQVGWADLLNISMEG